MFLTNLGENWIPIHVWFETIISWLTMEFDCLDSLACWSPFLTKDTEVEMYNLKIKHAIASFASQLPENVGHNLVPALTAVVLYRYQNVWLQSDNSRWIQPTDMRHCLHGQCCFCHQDHGRRCRQGCTWLASAEQQQLHNHSERSEARWWSVVSPKWWPDLHYACSLRTLSH